MQTVAFLAIIVCYYIYTIFALRATFTKDQLHTRLLLVSLLAAQFCLKLIDRYYLPAYASRAGDEVFWLQSLAAYQSTGTIPLAVIAQGTGIFYLVSATATLLHASYGSVLVGLAVVFGTFYILPVFFLYRLFFGGDDRLAFLGTLLVSMTDVMIYSTTIARPTLFGLFLLPLAIAVFQLLRGRFRWLPFVFLLVLSMMILFIHAPITYVVLLAIVSCTILLLDRVRRWEATYVIFIFASYGLTVRILFPDLDRIWRTEIFSGPLSWLSNSVGGFFFLVFPAIGVGIVGLSSFIGSMIDRFHFRRKKPFAKLPISFVLFLLIVLAGFASVFVFWKYSNYISGFYGGFGPFLLLHGWKAVFGLVALVGLWKIGGAFKRASNDSALAWLISLVVIVAALATYSPLMRFYGLWNLDERFAEFAYYPVFYFVTVGLGYLAKRFRGARFGWLATPALALYVIPSIIVGTQVLALLKS